MVFGLGIVLFRRRTQPAEGLVVVLPNELAIEVGQPQLLLRVDKPLVGGRLKPSRSPLDILLYISFFPHLVAGPIVRAHEFLPQLASPRRAEDFGFGLVPVFEVMAFDGSLPMVELGGAAADSFSHLRRVVPGAPRHIRIASRIQDC